MSTPNQWTDPLPPAPNGPLHAYMTLPHDEDEDDHDGDSAQSSEEKTTTKRSLMARITPGEQGVIKVKALDEEGKRLFDDLCEASRRGDLEAVDTLVTNYNVDVNQVDEFDYSPLILASLCGHVTIVTYLLEHGARCDRDTFQGERCIYGALTDEIRGILLKYDLSKAVDTSQPFASHITRELLGKGVGSDVVFRAVGGDGNVDFELHKFILAARSPYFKRNLQTRWRGKKLIKLAPIVHPLTFEAVIKVLYIGELLSLPPELSENLRVVTKSLEMEEVGEMLMSGREKKNLNDLRKELVRKAQGDMGAWVRDQVIGKVRKVDKEEDIDNVVARIREEEVFADVVLRVNLHDDDDDDSSSENENENGHGEGGGVLLYPAQKAMLSRSEYYQLMFSGPFSESHSPTLPTVLLDVNPRLTPLILEFIYTDRVAHIPPPHALDLVFAADMLLLDRLKSLAAIEITKTPPEDPPEGVSMYDVLRAAWSTRTERLEHHAASHFAAHLETYLTSPLFASIVSESASRISSRQETDTIELIDDIRYYLGLRYGILNELVDERGRVQGDGPGGGVALGWGVGETEWEREYNERVLAIEELLEGLGLEA
ncbi:hypothetical protein G7K_5573-t1 [Saitoella complicata NRRL Y-17804]|uniref:BTB domain-containing protein n=1 Tax=Saitoella complicata (strain BCRC 22490 / CBS 7301 / JCM 7358 / NBRC 10748 / NRRL Y-17804) TaxID=698492 RepID=A0A0E9NNU9_SAICN|nr:hypothetical protein G7K_5573-t1 [Saitoella complicata NRRL Y-17804]